MTTSATNPSMDPRTPTGAGTRTRPLVNRHASILQKLGGSSKYTFKRSPTLAAHNNITTLVKLQAWKAVLDRMRLNQIVNLYEDNGTDQEGSQGESSAGRMVYKPSNAFFNPDSSRRLQKDLEFLIGQLEHIQWMLSSQVEHDPSLIRNLERLASRINKTLNNLQQRIGHVSAPTNHNRKLTASLSRAQHLNTAVVKLLPNNIQPGQSAHLRAAIMC